MVPKARDYIVRAFSFGGVDIQNTTYHQMSIPYFTMVWYACEVKEPPGS